MNCVSLTDWWTKNDAPTTSHQWNANDVMVHHSCCQNLFFETKPNNWDPCASSGGHSSLPLWHNFQHLQCFVMLIDIHQFFVTTVPLITVQMSVHFLNISKHDKRLKNIENHKKINEHWWLKCWGLCDDFNSQCGNVFGDWSWMKNVHFQWKSIWSTLQQAGNSPIILWRHLNQCWKRTTWLCRLCNWRVFEKWPDFQPNHCLNSSKNHVHWSCVGQIEWIFTMQKIVVKIPISCLSDCVTNHDFSSVPLTPFTHCTHECDILAIPTELLAFGSDSFNSS